MSATDFIAFPLRVNQGGGQEGWLQRMESQEAGILALFTIMANTASRGWKGLAEFGLRDLLAELQTRSDKRSAVIKQVNQVLLELGINWVKVENIAMESADEFGVASYLLTLAYKDKGAITHRLGMR